MHRHMALYAEDAFVFICRLYAMHWTVLQLYFPSLCCFISDIFVSRSLLMFLRLRLRRYVCVRVDDRIVCIAP